MKKLRLLDSSFFQALNENIDKVMIIPNLLICHRKFCVKVGFCFGAVEVVSPPLGDGLVGKKQCCCGRSESGGVFVTLPNNDHRAY